MISASLVKHRQLEPCLQMLSLNKVSAPARLMTACATTSKDKRNSTRVNRRKYTALLRREQRGPSGEVRRAKLRLTSSPTCAFLSQRENDTLAKPRLRRQRKNHTVSLSLTISRSCRRLNCVIGCLSWLVLPPAARKARRRSITLISRGRQKG